MTGCFFYLVGAVSGVRFAIRFGVVGVCEWFVGVIVFVFRCKKTEGVFEKSVRFFLGLVV